MTFNGCVNPESFFSSLRNVTKSVFEKIKTFREILFAAYKCFTSEDVTYLIASEPTTWLLSPIS
jgi:hypothetical protein